ncbi:GNAT family N-acetyltransferase [Pseudovibrio sp. JE062]|uniref:GNAT family N-acetyltransferase n=1 Tax=Pseudovibrio sp. JE062 TaxID=439495 RepID=UPI000186B734|nr:GNAT family N-acetyltransferase [Pseudovibrio sp. JE062]EEA93903.1 acetyltransferase, gnat family [Pseudovibrio sp. JE062]
MIEDVIDKSPRIETERLVLRKWEPRDLEGLIEMNADPKVMEFFPAVMSRQDSERMFERLLFKQEEFGFGTPVVEEKATGRFLGLCGLGVPTYPEPLPFDPCVEIGWRLIPDAWGRGVAQEAARIWLRFGFETLRLNEIVSFTSSINWRSEKVMQRLGMLRDASGDFDHPLIEDGHPLKPHVLYRISEDQFREQGHG